MGCGLSNARARRRAAALRSGAESSRGQVGVQECHYIVIIYTVAIINFIFLFHSAISSPIIMLKLTVRITCLES